MGCCLAGQVAETFGVNLIAFREQKIIQILSLQRYKQSDYISFVVKKFIQILSA
jgi:hypothetical protein